MARHDSLDLLWTPDNLANYVLGERELSEFLTKHKEVTLTESQALNDPAELAYQLKRESNLTLLGVHEGVIYYLV